MQLINYDPFKELDNIFNHYYSARKNQLAQNSEDQADFTYVSDWSPVVDIAEHKDSYLIKAEIPGVEKEDINISLENGILFIKGEKKLKNENKDAKNHKVECFYGKFVRSFSLPDSVDQENIEASYDKGVLSLKILKTTKSQAKAIEVKIK